VLLLLLPPPLLLLLLLLLHLPKEEPGWQLTYAYCFKRCRVCGCYCPQPSTLEPYQR
jgi:hypothetical protein